MKKLQLSVSLTEKKIYCSKTILSELEDVMYFSKFANAYPNFEIVCQNKITPRKRPTGFYIYIYKYKNKVVYVGKTKSLDMRIQQHSKEIKFYGLQQIYYEQCDSEEEMTDTENFLIKKYKPILNENIPKKTPTHYKDFFNWKKYETTIKYENPLISALSLEDILKKADKK